MSTKMSHTVDFQPMHLFGYALLACLVTFVIGLAVASPAHSAAQPVTSCTSSAH